MPFSNSLLVTLANLNELSIARALFKFSNIQYLPNAVFLKNYIHQTKTCGDTILFVGVFTHMPNEDGITYFVKTCWERIQAAFSSPIFLNLVGAKPTQNILGLRSDSIRVYGDVEDLEEYYSNSDIAIVPIRFGGGTRVKVLEAFSYGVPIVTTQLGIDGLSIKNGIHAIIEDEPDRIINGCIDLLKNSNKRSIIAKNAYKWLLESDDWQIITKTVLSIAELGYGSYLKAPPG